PPCSLSRNSYEKGPSTSFLAQVSGDTSTPDCANSSQALGSGTNWDLSNALYAVGTASDTRGVSFEDGMFSIQNAGQLHTMVTLSGYYDMFGYLRNYGFSFLLGQTVSHTSIVLSMEVWPQVPTGPTPAAGTFVDYQSSLPDCSTGPVVGNQGQPCKNDLAVQGVIPFNHQFDLQPGTYYVIVYFEVSTHTTAVGNAQSFAMACFEASSACTSPLAGGRPALDPTSACPTGVASPCYYLQWKDTTYQLDDKFAGPADF